LERQVKIKKKKRGRSGSTATTLMYLLSFGKGREAAAFQCVAACESISSGGEAKVPVA
jgi:hypothetical protein